MINYTTLDQFLEQEGIAEEVHANTAKRLTELDAEELKPCPFCGGKPHRLNLTEKGWEGKGGVVIECTNCGASSSIEFCYYQHLINRWKRRVYND
jgi:Lar family restriction alleviation protein